MKTIIQTVKGAREFYPMDMAARIWLYNIIRKVSESFGYEEYDGPFLEKIDLYAAKSGEELVKEQSFVFPDRGGDYVTLRPELTPSLARMIAQRQRSLHYPIHWWSFGPFWRYERPQKGRTREFFQWNIDIIGSDSAEADAELVAISANFFKMVGFPPDQVQILVNNRRLMDAKFTEFGIPQEMRPDVFRLIDKHAKLNNEEWESYALEIGLNASQLEEIRQILNNPDLWKESDELMRFFAAIEAMGVADYVKFDPKIIRGLDYYTGTVFEAYHLGEGGRSILGGGRYDNLVDDVGGDPLTGAGFAMGDVLILLLLQKYGLLPDEKTSPADIMVSVFDEKMMIESIALTSDLRNSGIKTMCYPEAAKLNKQFKYADRLGIRYVVVLGPDEIANGQVAVKDLLDRSQQSIPRDEIVARVIELLAQPNGV
ncbi:MAG: histidine--tRNA ligase [Anaerolineaceae bacterium]|nr:histidine--tRNA ligase [Anaerolineaceae bacterium]